VGENAGKNAFRSMTVKPSSEIWIGNPGALCWRQNQGGGWHKRDNQEFDSRGFVDCWRANNSSKLHVEAV
jgi:hypothetical protein